MPYQGSEMAKKNKKPVFSAEHLMIAMAKHQKKTNWKAYAAAISKEAEAQGCAAIEESHLPRRLGQIKNKCAPHKPPPYPARPTKAPPRPETIAEIAKRLGWSE